jgi:hypothetical protein
LKAKSFKDLPSKENQRSSCRIAIIVYGLMPERMDVRNSENYVILELLISITNKNTDISFCAHSAFLE